MALLLGWVVWASRLLRPIADDYCIAVIAGQGLPQAVVHWHTTWSGDVTVWASNTVLVGIPLVYLPFSIASSLPFLTATLSVTICGLVLAWTTQSARVSVRRWALPASGLALSLPIAWWSYWWAPITIGAEGDQKALADAITQWQNINAAYVVPTVTLVAFYLWAKSQPRLAPALAASLVLGGLFAGLAGPVIASGSVVYLAILSSLAWLQGRLNPNLGWRAVVFSVAATLGAFLSLTSSGTNMRRAAMASTGTPPPESLTAIYQYVFPSSLAHWFLAVFNLGSLVVLVTVALVCLLARATGVTWSIRGAMQLGLTLLLFSLVLSIANRVAEVYVYSAYWHRVSMGTVVFFALVSLGIAVGTWAAETSRLLNSVIVAAAILVAFPLMCLSAGNLVTTVAERHSRWEIGAAPTARIADLEPGSGWATCWFDLGLLRELPSRSISNPIRPSPIPS